MTPKLLSAEELDFAMTMGSIPALTAHIAALEADNAALLEVVHEVHEAIRLVAEDDVTEALMDAQGNLGLAIARTHPGAHLLAEVLRLREHARLATEHAASCATSRLTEQAEHATALEAAAFLCCGGSDEHPPAHTQDCHALVRARNEGLEKAAAWHDGKGDAERTWLDMNEGKPNRPTTEAHRSFLECHRSSAITIRALKEPES